MRRAIVTSTATVSGIILLLGLKSHGAGAALHAGQTFSIGSGSGTGSTSVPAPSASSSSSSSAASGSAPAANAPSASKSTASGSSATRVITGASADTRYGPVQLQVTFAGKKITNINVLVYPTESGRDQEINSYALPILNQEAMAAQSANIDSVSGASYTSQGYTQSLQSAIDQAG